MENFSILDLKETLHGQTLKAGFFVDLNIDQIINQICAPWGKEVKGFYSYFPKDKECEAYRREIYKDIIQPQVYQALTDFLDKASEFKECEKRKNAVRSPLQKCVWQMWEISKYCDACDALLSSFSKITLSSHGMQTFYAFLKQYLESVPYLNMKKEVNEVLSVLLSFRFTLTYENDRYIISTASEQDTAPSYEDKINYMGHIERAGFHNPFQNNPDLCELENEILEILTTKETKLFQSLKETTAKYINYADATLMRFYEEIPFYLSYHAFELKMMEKGHTFCIPQTDETKEMGAVDLYDLALAIVLSKEDKQVVSNTFTYHENESFFVLTGPNQGGKTTFARSLGQLVYFTKMGLRVPASSANVHYYNDIMTHFSVEESVETGRGKLKEELIRLKPMMEEDKQNCFVVINELFTTAASYDAEIMGRKVLTHFIDQKCRGIYVTHLKELAGVHERIASICAMLDENHLQNFRITRQEAANYACAANQVNKYHLTYEQLKERL